MVIGVVAAFAAGAAGVAAAATATTLIGTIAAYATIAGAVLTGVGALTGSKDLMKIGAVLSIGGGLTSLATGATEAASATASEGAVSGMDVAADQVGTASAGMGASTSAVPDAVAPLTDMSTGAAPPSGEVLGNVTTPMPNVGTTPIAQQAASINPAMDTSAISTPMVDGSNAAAGSTLQTPDPSMGFGKGGFDFSKAAKPDMVAQSGAKMTTSDLSAFMQKAKEAGGAVSDFMSKNPALMKVGGDMLSSMYGAQAEKFDYEKGLMDRARANLNAPVKLVYQKPGG